MRLIALLAVLLLMPVVAATQSGATPVATGPLGQDCAPPCGWIDPIIDLRFPDKPTCAAALGQAPELTTCLQLPAQGHSIVMEGSIAWWWDVSEDGTYPMDPSQDIQITFSATASDPEWLPFTVEPSTFTLSNQDLLDPANMVTEDRGTTTPRILFWFERPITITITRDGEPTQQEVERIEDRGGIQSVFVKAKSTESGDRFRPGYGVEEFRFAAAPEVPAPEDQGASLGLLVPLLAVVAAALLRGRQPPTAARRNG